MVSRNDFLNLSHLMCVVLLICIHPIFIQFHEEFILYREDYCPLVRRLRIQFIYLYWKAFASIIINSLGVDREVNLILSYDCRVNLYGYPCHCMC